MNQNIIKYLIENKEKYSKEVLVAELDKAGYGEDEIVEAIRFVYNAVSPQEEGGGEPANFWDFKTKKIYTKKFEKIIDFLAGFFVIAIMAWIAMDINDDLVFIPLILYIFSLFYFFKKRRFIFYGLLADLLIPIAGIIFLFFAFGGF